MEIPHPTLKKRGNFTIERMKGRGLMLWGPQFQSNKKAAAAARPPAAALSPVLLKLLAAVGNEATRGGKGCCSGCWLRIAEL